MWVTSLKYSEAIDITDEAPRSNGVVQTFVFDRVNSNYVDITLVGGITIRSQVHKPITQFNPIKFRITSVGERTCAVSIASPSNYRYKKVDRADQ